MRALLLLGLWCVSAIGPPPPGHWAKDTTGKISAPTLQALDQIAGALNGTGDGQLGVLVVGTTSGQAPRAYATEVFNHWGIGHSGYKNGILLFVALDDRKAEIILGDGLGGVSTGDTDRIMREQVVSNFKAGKPEQALLEGARALAGLLSRQRPAPVAEQAQPLSTQDALTEQRVSELFRTGELPDPSPRKWVVDLTGEVPSETVHALERLPNELYAAGGRQLFLVFFRSRTFDASEVRERSLASLSARHPRAALLAVNLERPEASFAFPPELSEDPRAAALSSQIEAAANGAPAPGDVREANLLAGPVLLDGFPPRSVSEVVGEAVDRFSGAMAAVGGMLALGGFFWGRRWNRYRPRACESCQRPRQLLPSGAEDKHLSPGQQTEQSVGSIDYDVWWCGVCRTVLVRNNSRWFSGYGTCRQCKNATLKSSSTTVTHATEYSGGLVRIDEKCAHCSYTNTYTRATARITRSSSSSSSSRSSSSGSSFGGGSSSGRGSSGSW